MRLRGNVAIHFNLSEEQNELKIMGQVYFQIQPEIDLLLILELNPRLPLLWRCKKSIRAGINLVHFDKLRKRGQNEEKGKRDLRVEDQKRKKWGS